VTGADVLSAMVRESRSQSNWKNTVDTRQRWDMTYMEVEKTLDLVGFTNVVFKLTKIMLDAEADASDNTQLELPNMLLLVECEAGHLKLAKMLLGADASTSNKQGNTPLLAVTQQGDVELLKILKAAMSETAEAVAVASAASRKMVQTFCVWLFSRRTKTSSILLLCTDPDVSKVKEEQILQLVHMDANMSSNWPVPFSTRQKNGAGFTVVQLLANL